MAKTKLNSKIEASIFSDLRIYNFKNFDIKTVEIDSEALKKNPLKDPSLRRNPVLSPKIDAPKEGWPVVFVLAGLTGNGPRTFSPKTFEENIPESIDSAVTRNKAPLAIYVFVDAMTFWGGSQFVNSGGSGRYEDYVVKELYSSIKENFSVTSDAKKVCVTGVSSGGYGALHLSSKYPEKFGICGALAADSDFEKCLLTEFFEAAPALKSLGVEGIKAELEEGRLFRRKIGHTLINVVAMAHCYAPLKGKKVSAKDWPIDLETGDVKKDLWKEWLKFDPVYFLKKRRAKIEKLKHVYLDVGRTDQFHLAFGHRKMRAIFNGMKVPLKYSEFNGGHFDMGPRRLIFWEWLSKQF